MLVKLIDRRAEAKLRAFNKAAEEGTNFTDENDDDHEMREDGDGDVTSAEDQANAALLLPQKPGNGVGPQQAGGPTLSKKASKKAKRAGIAAASVAKNRRGKGTDSDGWTLLPDAAEKKKRRGKGNDDTGAAGKSKGKGKGKDKSTKAASGKGGGKSSKSGGVGKDGSGKSKGKGKDKGKGKGKTWHGKGKK